MIADIGLGFIDWNISFTSLAVSIEPVVSIMIFEPSPSIIIELASAKPTAICTPSVTSIPLSNDDLDQARLQVQSTNLLNPKILVLILLLPMHMCT